MIGLYVDELMYKRAYNLIYIIKNWFRWDVPGTVFVFLQIPVALLLPIVKALLPKMMVDAIQGETQIQRFILMLTGLSVLVLVLTWMKKFLDAKIKVFQTNISMHYAIEMMEKLLYMNYRNLESYEGRALFQRCKKFAFEGAQSDGAWAAVRLSGLLTSLFGIVTYAVLFSKLNIWLIIIILATCSVEFFSCSKTIQYGDLTANEMVKGEMKFFYLYRIASNPATSKDIRLSHASEWLLGVLDKAVYGYMKIMHWYTVKATELTGVQALCTILRDVATFLFLIEAVLCERLLLGDFLFYFNLVTGFSDWINGISGHVRSLKRIAVECDHYRQFLEMPDPQSGDNYVSLQSIKSIEFCNVSFGYTTEEKILKNINIKIHAGEKIAIVGENGAGKTTLIKLLCGLYQPTSGEILINGINIRNLDLKEYYKFVSAIFQDYMVLPSSIKENITLGEEATEMDLIKLLKQVGLEEKIQQIDLDAKIGKQIDTVTDLSGGEKQKLLLARALYKKAQLLILDEPTAALDPIAEEKLYLQYKDLAKERISVFISHRLNSTQFCDRIIFMSQGRIVEEGTHEELIQKDGKYKKMYDAQAYYYREVFS